MVVNNIAIEIEGVDKSGKDLLAHYLNLLGEYRYTNNVRGILTQLVYNDKFNRNYTYKLPYIPFIIFLDVDPIDQRIRSSANNEPKINVDNDREAYYRYIEELKKHGAQVLIYNTSEITPYNIVKDVLNKLETIDINKFICKEVIELRSLELYKNKSLSDEQVIYKFNN